jgi:acyl-CoA thioester hydrolase
MSDISYQPVDPLGTGSGAPGLRRDDTRSLDRWPPNSDDSGFEELDVTWDLPAPHTITVSVTAADIDAYDHVNNSVYMNWFDRVAWDHSGAVGLPIERCLSLNRGMVVLRSVIAYLRPSLRGDVVRIATWLIPNAGRVRVARRFQVFREADRVTLARAEIEYACVELSSGRPSRWPAEFTERYKFKDEVAAAYLALEPV